MGRSGAQQGHTAAEETRLGRTSQGRVLVSRIVSPVCLLVALSHGGGCGPGMEPPAKPPLGNLAEAGQQTSNTGGSVFFDSVTGGTAAAPPSTTSGDAAVTAPPGDDAGVDHNAHGFMPPPAEVPGDGGMPPQDDPAQGRTSADSGTGSPFSVGQPAVSDAGDRVVMDETTLP